VIKVPMGQQYRDRLEPVLQDQPGNPGHCIHPWIDDYALIARFGSRQVAVRLPWPGRERRQEHAFETIETIGQD
jgi:hypothetical protein